MADLIDRDWVLKRMVLAPDADVVKMAPKVDGVPVVRCKDCKWYNSGFIGCTKSGFCPDPDFFCACGAKMGGEASV